ncbi:enolase family protein [Trichomonas vaginalis G3]|uniref:phosphopyruvate hydratase n=1 Tax=Trichomonas vaginalis (strain ATCC PRA-98 / G3) TaxID=412133 RepID=A2EP01_TRIV3|nr:phosphopyruvate hydratase family [Trichomonas vaginalis G3]EAY05605.1 enolase family protein [Trichomonas vaginalis G3]KAI5486845.1 phosphopyruvate hydratase family [Trichomonas vaginalis G3]|eukprot:XP_001317828.1 enolase family protein [Trichomonas vaginalis G3]
MSADKVAESKTYIETSKVREVLQEGLNLALEKKPEDLAGFLSKLLESRALPPTIHHLVGREVLDSRGNPTVEVDVYANFCGRVVFAGRSSAPSGASTGSNEAVELRDKDPKRYNGKGTLKAAKNVTEIISPALKDVRLEDLYDLDSKIRKLDGTELKTNLGGNACTATSFALATAAAKLYDEPLFVYLARMFHKEMPEKFKLPQPFFNILNGGKHAGGNLKLQEFMVAPSTTHPFPDQLRMVAEVYQKLGARLVKDYDVSAKNLGDEGGYAPLLNSPEETLTIIEAAIQDAGYVPGEDIFIGLDAASSEFYDENKKLYEVEVGVFKTGAEMVEYWKNLVEKHPAIISIEDGLQEKDYEHWKLLNSVLGDRIQLVGDDLYTTNPKTIEKGIKGKWCNALLLKVNQIGTISEAMRAASLILKEGQNVMVSHRSGETGNSLIADLAVAIGAQSIKTGSTARGERIQKYTRLLQIYEYLKENDMLEE